MAKKFSELRDKMSPERRQRNAEAAAKLNAQIDWPELCNTCHRPYDKFDKAQYCSNGFHCCRDCCWDNGKIIIRCEYHEKKRMS